VAFRSALHSTLEWRMRQSRRIAAVVWKDKKPILLLSTHPISIGFPCMPVPMVPKRNGTTVKIL
jgi:hypothetical protein